MAEAAPEPEEVTPQPAANPDAQTTVSDFLDYTEYFPSDLVRSLRLIGDLDQSYVDATQAVHQLTVKYGKLPTLAAGERSDPVALRREIAHALDKAIYARESSYAEASRLFEVAERHKHRIGIIRKKLKEQPEPPSRDPTPVPVSPQAQRSLNRNFATPHLRLTLDGRYGGGSTARPRDRKKVRNRAGSFSDSDVSEVRPRADPAVAPTRLSSTKDKTPKPQKIRVRAPGTGTNVHSQLAGISTSNALARLTRPPDNAKPGSKWAPWLELTEYEMAVLRKKMKKNAVWTPSDAMIKKQLELSGRGQEAKDKEKERCKQTGEELLDEEPEAPTLRLTVPLTPLDGTPVPGADPTAADTVPTPLDVEMEDAETPKATPAARDTRRLSTRDSRRQQAVRDAHDLEMTTKKIREAADYMQELTIMNGSTSKRPAARPSNKRKRDCTPQPAVETPAEATREPSLASQDSASKPPERKKLKLNLSTTAGGASSPQNLTPVGPSPGVKTPVPFPETTKTTTVQVPLAPAGPATPKSAGATQTAVANQSGPLAVISPAVATSAEAQTSPAVSAPAPSQPNVTAASSRPRRESVAPPKEKPSSPAPATAPPVKKQRAPTPGPETVPPIPDLPARPRSSRPNSSRGHVPTPKAQSEEPTSQDQGANTRELRRHSVFGRSGLVVPDPASASAPKTGPIRTSKRRKPPPKGEITNGEDGQKTVMNVKRAQGNKNKRKKKPEEESEPAEEIDQDEEKYCVCDDVSWGTMLACDNECEKEWFHLTCVGLGDHLPPRRSKWYCPACRVALGTDAYGNPIVPPPLPGRRGNR